jgi:hypothetical protein
MAPPSPTSPQLVFSDDLNLVEAIIDVIQEDDERWLVPLRTLNSTFKAAIDRRLFSHVVLDTEPDDHRRLTFTMTPRLDGSPGKRLPLSTTSGHRRMERVNRTRRRK